MYLKIKKLLFIPVGIALFVLKRMFTQDDAYLTLVIVQTVHLLQTLKRCNWCGC